MKNRLVFKDPKSTSTNHGWNKYETNRGQHFIFDKYSVNTAPLYRWKKSQLIDATEYTYVWDRYEPTITEGYHAFSKEYRTSTTNQSYTYSWNKRKAFRAGTTLYTTTTYEPAFIWDDYDTNSVPIYDYSQWGLDEQKTVIPYSGIRTMTRNTYDYYDSTDGQYQYQYELNNKTVDAGNFTVTASNNRDGYVLDDLADFMRYRSGTGERLLAFNAVSGTNGYINEDNGYVTIPTANRTKNDRVLVLDNGQRTVSTIGGNVTVTSPRFRRGTTSSTYVYDEDGEFEVVRYSTQGWVANRNVCYIRLADANYFYNSIDNAGYSWSYSTSERIGAFGWDALSRLFVSSSIPGEAPHKNTNDPTVWMRLELVSTGVNASGYPTATINVRLFWDYSVYYPDQDAGPDFVFQKVIPGASTITGYTQEKGAYLGEKITSSISAFSKNDAPYTTDEGTVHWIVYNSATYGNVISLTNESTTAPTVTDLTLSYTDMVTYMRTHSSFVGAPDIRILQQPEADPGSTITVVRVYDDANAYPVAGFVTEGDNLYYYEFAEKAVTALINIPSGIEGKGPGAYNAYTADQDSEIYCYLYDNNVENDWRPNSLYVDGSKGIKMYKTFEDACNGSDDYYLLTNTGEQITSSSEYRWYRGSFYYQERDDISQEAIGYVRAQDKLSISASKSSYAYWHQVYQAFIIGFAQGQGTQALTWSGWHLYLDNVRKPWSSAAFIYSNIPYLQEHYMGLQPKGNDYLVYIDPSGPAQKTYGPGTYVTTITSSNPDLYPIAGMQGKYYYVLRETIEAGERSAGEYIEDVTSYDNSTYPDNDGKDGYYYEYLGSKVEYSKSDFIERIVSQSDIYPHGGADGKYYYEFIESSDSTYPGTLLEEVFSPSINSYPQNGEGADGYYYIYTGRQPSALYSITQTEMKGGVSYSQNSNPSTNIEFGAAASSSIEVEILDDELDAQKYIGLICDWYVMMGDENSYRKIGTFNVTDIKHSTSISSKLTAFDNMTLLDKDVEQWLRDLSYPITLGNMFASLCRYCGATYKSSTFTNSDFKVYENVAASGITGRQVLAYICQVAGGFARANSGGSIEISNYATTTVSLDKGKYIKSTLAVYDTAEIHKLTIKGTEDDIGTTVGTGDAVYTIIGNPLLFTDSAEDLSAVSSNLLKIIESITYSPGTVKLQQDYGIDVGDIIQVDGRTFYVMEKSIKSDGVELKSFGEKDRVTVTSQVNTELIALRGKTNELSRDLDSTKSTLTDNTKQLQSQIEQTASSLDAQIKSQGNTISEIKADLDGIQLTYNSAAGTASLRIGDITVSNLVDGNYVTKAVAGIEMTGYVKFNDLERAGSTTINGSNITTGTISADRINLTGAVTWSDLSDSAKNQIYSFASDAAGQTAEVPSYIKSTYIDSVNILSPNIYGAKITAGTNSGNAGESYIQMSNTGLNMRTNTGHALISFGYYPGNYSYPYIMLGAGIDSVGTDRGMIKKYANGIWIGDSDGMIGSSVGSGTGLFCRFTDNTIWAYTNGTAKKLAP